MGMTIESEVETSDIAWAYGSDYEAAFDLVVRLAEMIDNHDWDERVIAMLQGA